MYDGMADYHHRSLTVRPVHYLESLRWALTVRQNGQTRTYEAPLCITECRRGLIHYSLAAKYSDVRAHFTSTNSASVPPSCADDERARAVTPWLEHLLM